MWNNFGRCPVAPRHTFTAPNVREIEERVIRAAGCDLLCPVDGRRGSAFVDSIVGVDNVGVSAWQDLIL